MNYYLTYGYLEKTSSPAYDTAIQSPVRKPPVCNIACYIQERF